MMPFFSDRSKFRSLFETMGCSPSVRFSQPVELGIQCKSVVPLLNKPHSKANGRPTSIRPVFEGGLRTRGRHVLTAYDRKSYTNPDFAQRKVFLSQPQSGTINDLGERRPCAPPVTPTPEMLRHVHYVPSMQDVQAQRLLRGKLQDIEKTKKQQKAKRKEAQAKCEAERKKEEANRMRVFQRSQIYALNAVMTDLEHQRFLLFQQQMSKT